MKTKELNDLDAYEAAALLARRELKAVDLMRACLDRVQHREKEVHAFAHIDPDYALARARALDAGPLRGPLHGLPLGVKDLFDTADMPTSYGSAIYAGYRPAGDAAAVSLCREAGALVIGKTVTTEFAYFLPGATRNPLNLAHTPGGSSSGSAAAVADHMLPLALGTQTAGSIIRPAAYCGVVGYKPSLGRVPRAGMKSMSEAFDTVGGFGRTVRDVALLGSVLTSDARLIEAVVSSNSPAPRLGLCRTSDWPKADADTQKAWAQATDALTPYAESLAEVSLPGELPDLTALHIAVMTFETARALSFEGLQHRDRLSERLRALLEHAKQISGAEHAANLGRMDAARRSIDSMFERVDVLIAPSASGEAPVNASGTGDPIFCRGWTLLGLPCVHLPFTKGRLDLPVGLQLVGRRHEDHRLLAVAQRLHERLVR